MRDLWRTLRRNRMGMVGLVMLLTVLVMAVFAPLIAPYDPYKPVRARIDSIYAAPSREHWKTVRVDQVLATGTGAGGVKRRMFDKPDHFAGGTASDLLGARLHEGQRIRIGGEARLDAPFDRC